MGVKEDIDAKITLYTHLIIDMIKTGRDTGDDVREYMRYCGIVEGLKMARDMVDGI